MPIWVTLYVAMLIVSLPMGVTLLRRLEKDWLHPFGALLSTLLSIIFVVAYWQPDVIALATNSTFLMFGFVLFWDLYSVLRVRHKMAEFLELNDMNPDDVPPGNSVWLIGFLLMLPAYIFASLVCLRLVP